LDDPTHLTFGKKGNRKNAMEKKQIDVTCPCCNTRLTVDVLTRKVMRQAAPGQVDDTGKAVLDETRWDSAQEKVAGRKDASVEKFDDALGQERTREKDLDDLFDKALRDAKRKPPEEET